MHEPAADPIRRTSTRATLSKALLLAAFAAAMFLAGRLWSLREVREARRAAGLAEQERLAIQAELTECRNALVLQRAGRDAANRSRSDP